MLIFPPTVTVLGEALQHLNATVKGTVLESYATAQKKPATHYVWRNDLIEKVWLTGGKNRSRVELKPSEQDIALAERFASYMPQRLRTPRFFMNSRINSSPSITLKDLFTGRALRNIDLLLAAIDELPTAAQEPMRLALTAAVGQMSKMVFTITGRGKITGASSEKMEVGSWMIGYWRPEQHSVASVVQDNRDGALRTDYGLAFSRSINATHSLTNIPVWAFSQYQRDNHVANFTQDVLFCQNKKYIAKLNQL